MRFVYYVCFASSAAAAGVAVAAAAAATAAAIHANSYNRENTSRPEQNRKLLEQYENR